MQASWYELLSLTARYWFVFLGLLIVVRSFRWLRKDRAERHRMLRRLPDAGSIGLFEVLSGSPELPVGSSLPVPHEGVLGYLRTCDVVVPVPGVLNRHCDLFFEEGKGLRVTPRHQRRIVIDGNSVVSPRDARETPMHHDSVLEVGEAVLRLRIFVGIDAGDGPEPLPELPLRASSQEAAGGIHDLPAVDAPYRIGMPTIREEDRP